MSINSEVLYSSLPTVNVQRSIMDVPFNHKTTFNAGVLIPVYASEMLPGSSVKIQTNKVIRAQTLLTPLMDTLELSTFWFFCPSRLTWQHWREFMGENRSSAYLPAVSYRPPRINFGVVAGAGGSPVDRGAIEVGSVADYLGVPVKHPNYDYQSGNWFLAQYLRSYWMIWNEFFRDQNLQDPINIPLGDSDVSWSSLSDTMKYPLPVNKFHDYFTSALKAPAKNAAGFVSAPVDQVEGAGSIPVYAFGTPHGNSTYALHGPIIGESNYTGNYGLIGKPAGTGEAIFSSSENPGQAGFAPDNLYAVYSGNSLAVSIPNLRMAFQMQRFLEKEAAGGSRYIETLLAHFGIRAQDSRLQRPEYLGGNQIPLNVSQVVNSAQSDGEFLGDVGGMSVTSDSHYDVEYSAQEHGILICCCAIRYRHSYSQGLDRMLQRTTRWDYAWPEMAHLTDQPIYNFEIFGEQTNLDPNWLINDVFGYQERYSEYRWKPSKTTCEMRPGIDGSLAAWHLGDLYTSGPYLSADWIKEDKAPVDCALAVTSEVSNQFFGDFFFRCRWTLPLPVHSEPGYADHF